MTLEPGNRVMRKGWEEYDDHQHLARRGTIIGPPVVEPPGWAPRIPVRWDAGRAPLGEHTPPREALEFIGELSWLWWRST